MAEAVTLIAKFNTKIETPSLNNVNDYDLDSVISKYGFNKDSDYYYELTTNLENASIDGKILTVTDTAYGYIKISVIDSKSGKSTSVSTKLYGFYALRLQAVNSQYIIDKMIGVISDTKSNWLDLLRDK